MDIPYRLTQLTRQLAWAMLLVASGAGAADQDSLQELAGVSYVELHTAGAEQDAALPMLIALHYMGGNPATSIADYGSIDVPTRLLALAGPHIFRDGHSWFPEGYYKLDSTTQDTIAFDTAQRIATFIRSAIETYPTRGKPVLVGYSQGADLTHIVALREPELISAGLPMGGRFPKSWRKGVTLDGGLPAEIALFHGAADAAVDVNESLAAAAFYTANGASVTLHTYDRVGHAYPERMKSDYKRVVERLLQAAGRD